MKILYNTNSYSILLSVFFYSHSAHNCYGGSILYAHPHMTLRLNFKLLILMNNWNRKSQQIWTDRVGWYSKYASSLDLCRFLLWLTRWNFATFNIFRRWSQEFLTFWLLFTQSMIYISWPVFSSLLLITFKSIFRLLRVNDGGAELAEAHEEQFWYCGVMVRRSIFGEVTYDTGERL